MIVDFELSDVARRAMRNRQVRTWREFAEQEIVLPNGPREGFRFDADYRPWMGEVLDLFGSGRYWRFFASGPTQDGKTLLFYVIPAEYELFELERDVLLGAPVQHLAWRAYRERLYPTIMAGRYRDLLPVAGGGSKGGKVPEIEFRNGATLRFIGAGGGDAQRSGWTAPVIGMTELDKMDDAGEASEEADPVTQMQERASSFLKIGAARVYGECTMSTEDGIIYREVCQIGTDTRVFLPCPGCGRWDFPERENFQGWSGQPSIHDARKNAAYVCPHCRHPWTEAEREESIKHPRLVSRGQTVTPDGKVEGPLPETHTFSVRWNAMHSPFKSMGDIAEKEWMAEFTEKEEHKKAVTQFWWVRPYKPDTLELNELAQEIVQRKVSGHPRARIPEGTVAIVTAIDLGKSRLHYVTIAWHPEAKGHVIDYGVRNVTKTGADPDVEILAELRVFRDEVLEPGWSQASGGTRGADLVLVDSGYFPSAAYDFVLESGQGRYAATKGFGSNFDTDKRRQPSGSKVAGMAGTDWWVTQQPDGIFLVNLVADMWKVKVHDGFAAAPGKPGSLTLFRGEPIEHQTFARQITGEKRVPEDDPKKQLRFRWHRTRANHYLDCFDSRTEVLTRLGWRLFKDVRSSDELGTVDLATDRIEYQRPTRLIERPHRGAMIRIGGAKRSRVDLLVTPNHRMVVYRGKGGTVEYGPIIKEAGDLDIYDKIKVRAEWVGCDERTIRIPAAGRLEAVDVDRTLFAEFMGWWVAEGSARMTDGMARIQIAQIKPKGRRKIRRLLDKLPWHFVETPNGFELYTQQLFAQVSELGRLQEVRRAPQWVKDSTSEVIETFVGAAVDGDGWRQHGNLEAYATVSPALAGDMQELYLKCGYGTSMRTVPGKPWRIGGRSGDKTLTQYHVYRNWKGYAHLRDGNGKPNFSVAPYDGQVYCATVPNGTLIVRRNGKVAVCGNCTAMNRAGAEMLGVRGDQAPPPDESKPDDKPDRGGEPGGNWLRRYS